MRIETVIEELKRVRGKISDMTEKQRKEISLDNYNEICDLLEEIQEILD